MHHIERLKTLVVVALLWVAVCGFKGWGDPESLKLMQSLLGVGNIAITQVEKQIERKGRK